MPDFATLTNEPQAINVAPGESASSTITLRNVSPLVDVFDVIITGLPSEFYRLSHSEFRLFPGDEIETDLEFSPPISSDILAGDYEFEINLSARNHPGETVSIPATLALAPYFSFETVIRPERITGPSANFSLSINNQSNTVLSFQGSGEDPEGFCQFQFPADGINVEAGHRSEFPIKVTTRKRPIRGKAKNYSLALTIIPDQVSDLRVVRAQFDATARLKGWVIPAVFVLGLVALVAVYSIYWVFFLKGNWGYWGSEKWDEVVVVNYPLTHGEVWSFRFDLLSDVDEMRKISKGTLSKAFNDASSAFNKSTATVRQTGASTSAADQKFNKIDSTKGSWSHRTTMLGGVDSEHDPSLKVRVDWVNRLDTVSNLTLILRTSDGKCTTPRKVTQDLNYIEYIPSSFPELEQCSSMPLASHFMNESSNQISKFEFTAAVKYCVTPGNEIIYESEGVPKVDSTYKPPEEPNDENNNLRGDWTLFVINESKIDAPPNSAEISLKANRIGAEAIKPLFFYRGEEKHPGYKIGVRRDISSGGPDRKLVEGSHSEQGCEPKWDEVVSLDGASQNGIEHGHIMAYQFHGCDMVYYPNPGCLEDKYSGNLKGLRSVTIDPTWDPRDTKSNNNYPNELLFVIRDPEGNCHLRTYQQKEIELDNPDSIDLLSNSPCSDRFKEYPDYLKSLINMTTLTPGTYYNSDPIVKFCKHEDSNLTAFNSKTSHPIPDELTWIDDPNVLKTQPGWYLYVINPDHKASSPIVTLRIKGDETDTYEGTFKLRLKIPLGSINEFPAESFNSNCFDQVAPSVGLPESEDELIVRFTTEQSPFTVSTNRLLDTSSYRWPKGIPGSLAWSRDGNDLAWSSNREGNSHIYVLSFDDLKKFESHDSQVNEQSDIYKLGNAKKLTFGSSDNFEPTWSPNGDQLAFTSNRDGNREIYIMDLTDREKVVTGNFTNTPNSDEYEPDWSENGKLIFTSTCAGQEDIYSYSVDDNWSMLEDGIQDGNNLTGDCSLNPPRSPMHITNEKQGRSWLDREKGVEFIAFISDKNGNEDVYIMAEDGKGEGRLTQTPFFEESNPYWISVSGKSDAMLIYQRSEHRQRRSDEPIDDSLRLMISTPDLDSYESEFMMYGASPMGFQKLLFDSDVPIGAFSWEANSERLIFVSNIE